MYTVVSTNLTIRMCVIKDDSNKNAVAGQTDKMWFKPGDEGKVYPTPFYTSAVAEDNLSQYPNSLTVGRVII